MENSILCLSCGKSLYFEHETTTDDLVCPYCGSNPKISKSKDNVEGADQEESEEWYLLQRSGAQRSGFSEKRIKEMIRAGFVRRDDYVWKKGLFDWLPIRDSVFAREFVDLMPPIPSKALSSEYLWMIATIPLTASYIIGTVLGKSSMLAIIIAFILNSIFAWKDSEVLKQSGFKTGGWTILSYFLVPVYLIFRTYITNTSILPFVVWIVLALILV